MRFASFREIRLGHPYSRYRTNDEQYRTLCMKPLPIVCFPQFSVALGSEPVVWPAYFVSERESLLNIKTR